MGNRRNRRKATGKGATPRTTDGKPVQLARSNSGLPPGPLRGLVQATQDGGFYFSGKALETYRARLARQAAITHVPLVPKYQQKDIAGVAYDRTSSRRPGPQLSFRKLREIRAINPLFIALHSACSFAYRSYGELSEGREGTVGFRVCHKDATRPGMPTPTHVEPYIRRVEAILSEPHPKYCPTLGDLVVGLGEDLLTINRPVLEILYSELQPNMVVGCRAVDGALIYDAGAYLEMWVKDNPGPFERYRDTMTADDALDLVSNILNHSFHTAEYVLVREDMTVEATYEPGRLIVSPVRRYTDVSYAGYPPSYLEETIEIAGAFWHTWRHQTGVFTEGNWADFLLLLSGDYSSESFLYFMESLRETTQGYRRDRRPPVMQMREGDLHKVNLKDTPSDMVFSNWFHLLLNIACSIYRRDPSVLNTTSWRGGQGPTLSAPSRSEEIALARSEGHISDVKHIAGMLTQFARRCHPEIVVIPETGEEDMKRRAELDAQQHGTWKTKNEIRLEHNKQPLGFWVPEKEYREGNEELRAKFEVNPYNQTADMVKNAQGQGAPGGQEEPEQPGEGQSDDQGVNAHHVALAEALKAHSESLQNQGHDHGDDNAAKLSKGLVANHDPDWLLESVDSWETYP